jgi:excisionase family DNA binding protein
MVETEDPIFDRARNVDEIAAYIDSTPQFVRDEIIKGRLRACKIGRLVRVLPKDLKAWLNRGATT